MKYLIAVDGGGTKTEAVLATCCGNVLRTAVTTGSNPLFVGEEKAIQAVTGSVMTVLGDTDPKDICGIAIAVPGIRRCRDRIVHELGLLPGIISFHPDDFSVFWGALAKDHGVVTLAGTGSFAMGVSFTGQRATVGGWGPVIGDTGSGHWIGSKALEAVAREFDQLGPKTALTEKILRSYRVEKVQQLRSSVAPGVAHLAPLVKETAEEGDDVALSIVRSAASGLAEMAVAVIERLGIDDELHDLALAGGISKFGEILVGEFEEDVRRSCQEINIVRPRFQPVIGSLLIAMRETGIPWTEETLGNLEASYRGGKQC
jgi:N-acetylglucosamine kinase-like BadF-type ATPase